MLKVKPHPDYPPEDGRYVKGNDASPAAVGIILNRSEDEIPPEIEQLVVQESKVAQHFQE